MTTIEYSFEKGRKFDSISVPFNSLHESLIESDEPFVRNGDFPEYASQFRDYKVPAGEIPLSVMSIPVYRNKEADIVVVVSIQDMDGHKTFGDSDVRLLETVAGAMSAALENARLFEETQRLLKETEQRNAELAIINSVQNGLASKLDFQSIIELVGDQVQATTNAKSVFIALYDKASEMVSWPYWVTLGERVEVHSQPLDREKNITRRLLYANKPLNLGTEEEILAHDAIPPRPGSSVGKSFLGVPFTVGDTILGALSIHDLDKEYAFSESDMRLMQTLANSMSVALENARLFDETQGLLKETEQRNAELAIINSVQAGLASKLEMQAIYDLVGDKVQEIFDSQSVLIIRFDQSTELSHIVYNFEKGKRFHTPPSHWVLFHDHLGPVMVPNDVASLSSQLNRLVLKCLPLYWQQAAATWDADE
jgi:GAF domain-containing protein